MPNTQTPRPCISISINFICTHSAFYHLQTKIVRDRLLHITCATFNYIIWSVCDIFFVLTPFGLVWCNIYVYVNGSPKLRSNGWGWQNKLTKWLTDWLTSYLTDQPADQHSHVCENSFWYLLYQKWKKNRKTNLLLVYFVAMECFFVPLSLCHQAQFLSWFSCVRCVNIVEWQIAIHFQ